MLTIPDDLVLYVPGNGYQETLLHHLSRKSVVAWLLLFEDESNISFHIVSSTSPNHQDH